MSKEFIANGLRLYSIPSSATPLPGAIIGQLASEDDLTAFVSTQISAVSFFVAYLDYTVIIGTYHDGAFQSQEQEPLDPTYLKRLRVFNSNQELLLWRTSSEFQGRLRRDHVETDPFVDVVEACQVLFGTYPMSEGGFTTISEDRGTSLTLPFRELVVDDETQRVSIRTRNYVEKIKETGQATYTDCRFVSFIHGKDELTP